MTLIAAAEDYDDFAKLLEKIKEVKDMNMRYLWFGYYARFGEEEGLWTREIIIEKVNAEQ